MKTEQHAVDLQRNDPLLTIQCCDTLNSSDENERTLEDLCECLRTIFEELRSKVELLPDPNGTSETYLNDTESRNKLYHTVNNVEKLIQDFKKRMMNGNLPKGGFHQDQVSTDDVRNKRDSGISSPQGSSQVSSASLTSDIGMGDCRCKNVSSSNVDFASSASKVCGLSEECTSSTELCSGISSLDQTDTRDVHFFLEPTDEVDVPFSQNVLYRIQVISKEKGKVRLSLIPYGVDTLAVSIDDSFGEKYAYTTPLLAQETASENLVETITSMLSDRRHENKVVPRHFPHLERQTTVEYSSTASLKQEYTCTQEVPTGLVHRRVCDCASSCESANDLSRFAVQHSESSEEDNTRQVYTQISSSSSGGSICRFQLSRPVTVSVDTQTEEVFV